MIILTFISFTYWNVLQSITLNVISVVPTSKVVHGEGLAASVFTGTGRELSGHPRREPMKGSQQWIVPSQVITYLKDSKNVSARIDFLCPV